MKVKIEISLKDGVLNPQAKTTLHALHSLGFDCAKDLKISKTMILDIEAQSREFALQKAREMSDTLLANTVIETYKIEVL